MADSKMSPNGEISKNDVVNAAVKLSINSPKITLFSKSFIP